MKADRKRSVLIVDDEVLVRIGIRHSVDWETHGFQIAGEASDGGECLSLIGKLAPDVIILDINMPKVNGIEVLKKLKEWKYRGKVIILTCYEDLEYARNAMKYGAADYVLKTTINEDGLLHALKELEFDEEQEGTEGKAGIISHDQKERLEKEALIRLLEGYPVSMEHSVIKPSHIYCITVKIRHLEEIMKRYADKKQDYFYTSLESMMNQALAGQKECVWIQYKPDIILVFLSFSFISSTQECLLKIRQMIDHLAVALRDYMALDIKIGVSAPKHKRERIPEAYQESLQAIEEGMVFPDRRIFYYEPEEREHSETVMKQLEKEMEVLVVARRYQELLEKSEGYFESIRSQKGAGMISRRKFLAGLMRLLKSLEQVEEHIEEQLNQTETLDEMETVVYRVLGGYITKEENGDHHYLIKKAKEYLKLHYSEPVTLGDLAGYMELSESYTSRIFNREMGMNIAAYINELRIGQAKKLLLNTNKKIYEIAGETGYASTTAFHIAFKKSEGITPAEFRNQSC